MPFTIAMSSGRKIEASWCRAFTFSNGYVPVVAIRYTKPRPANHPAPYEPMDEHELNLVGPSNDKFVVIEWAGEVVFDSRLHTHWN